MSDETKKITAKQALKQLLRHSERLAIEIDRMRTAGADPWRQSLDFAAINYAIPLVEGQMRENAEKHEGGTAPRPLILQI